MFFSRLVVPISWLAFLFGIAIISVGFWIAQVDDPAVREQMATRYFNLKSSGEVIDRGLLIAFVGVVLGTLGEIARKLR